MACQQQAISFFKRFISLDYAMIMTGKRGYVSLLLLFLWSGLLQAASVSFAPVVRNFSVSDYHARIQNWAVAQDANGVMYIGNSKAFNENGVSKLSNLQEVD